MHWGLAVLCTAPFFGSPKPCKVPEDHVRVPLDGVRMARKKMWVTHEKARRELGFNPGPADVALAHAVEWFRLAHSPAA